MKSRLSFNQFVVIALAVFALAAANQERIRWKWHDNTVLLTMQDNEHGKVEFGLRNDGVVVWREIKPATTNSPAEEPELRFNTNQFETWHWWTNVVTTNIILNGNTNGRDYTIPYVPPWHHPEWTNWEEGARWWSNQTKF